MALPIRKSRPCCAPRWTTPAIEAIDAALVQDGEALLSESELSAIRLKRNELEERLESAGSDELKQLIKAVEQVSETYVARRMNASVRQALAGKQIDEVDV
jgi:molecular chaperone HscA